MMNEHLPERWPVDPDMGSLMPDDSDSLSVSERLFLIAFLLASAGLTALGLWKGGAWLVGLLQSWLVQS